MNLTQLGRQMAARTKRLEAGYNQVHAHAMKMVASRHPESDLYEMMAIEAKKGLTFLDELKRNLYGFSQELNQIPGGFETARVAVQRSAAPALDAVLSRAEAHLANLKMNGMERKRPQHGGMGVWYNPLDWASDAADAAQSAVVKTALLGLAIYAGYKVIKTATETK